MKIIVSTQDNYVEVASEVLRRRRFTGMGYKTVASDSRENALRVLENLSTACEDPNARALFDNLHFCLR